MNYVNISDLRAGRTSVANLPADDIILESWRHTIDFFAGENPMGVIGSFLQDKFDEESQYIFFKHNYLLFAPDCGIMLELYSRLP